MSKEKKGFIVYDDNMEVVSRLSDEEAGQLLKGMLEYSITGKQPKFKGVLEFVFIPIKQQMDRNAEKYAAKCEKNRENVKLRWERVKNANAYERIRSDTNYTDTDTDKDTDTKKDTDTDTTTDTKSRSGGRYECDDEFNIWKRLTPDDIDVLYEKFPNTGGLLIDTVYEDVKAKKTKVKSGLKYILGYAKNVGWDENADNFKAPWEAM
jgi:hypothetical protein